MNMHLSFLIKLSTVPLQLVDNQFYLNLNKMPFEMLNQNLKKKEKERKEKTFIVVYLNISNKKKKEKRKTHNRQFRNCHASK